MSRIGLDWVTSRTRDVNAHRLGLRPLTTLSVLLFYCGAAHYANEQGELSRKFLHDPSKCSRDTEMTLKWHWNDTLNGIDFIVDVPAIDGAPAERPPLGVHQPLVPIRKWGHFRFWNDDVIDTQPPMESHHSRNCDVTVTSPLFAKLIQLIS